MQLAFQVRPSSGDTAGGEENRLLALIRERSFARGDFTLSSGKKSSLYFNMKPTMMAPEGAYLSARALLRRARQLAPEYIGGLEMGAVPIVAALAAMSFGEGAPLKTFFVRKKPKEHGTKLLVEGLAPGETLDKRRVVVVDDVTTSGASTLKAAEAAREAGAEVVAAISLVDRQEGAEELLAQHGLQLVSVFKASDFLREGELTGIR
jgi:orotate phosphoribosyltransferase